jgi:hypothetical protein
MPPVMCKICFCFILSVCCANLLTAQENLVKNPGFEQKESTNSLPAGGWWPFEGRGKTTVAVDSSLAHSGKNSLRIQGDAEAKFTFVSPKFDVAPGDELHFETWIRAQNLPTNQPAPTAGLAFRHRDGRVIQRDYFHIEQPGENWSLISGAARAPAEAVSAEVHLGYANGPGTIWYDDVTATITNPVSLALIEGAKSWPGAQEITVKVSNREAKEFRGTVSCVIAKKTFKMPVEIEPHGSRNFNIPVALDGVGQHRYKLALLDADGNSLRQLEGNFSTTAPLVLFPACPCYQVAGRGDGTTRIDARVNVNPALRAGLKLVLEVSDASGKKIQQTEADASAGEFVGSTIKLPVGQPAQFSVVAELRDGAGKQLATDKTDVHLVASDDAKVSLGDDGFLRIGGQPSFPIGLYNCGRFEEMGKAGFTATHEYGITTGEAEDAINPNERHVQELLDESWSNGMRMMIELPRKAIEKARWDQVRRRIETFRNHPGLLCWGSEERVARGIAPLANIAALYKLVHELDPDHPLVLGDTRDVIQNLQVDRRDFFPDPDMDIGIWWWYPIPLKEPDGNGLEGGANSANLLEPPSWLTTTHSKKPLWIAIQSYQKPSKDARFPTPTEYRAQAYLSIIDGVKGLFFYVGYGQKDFQGKPAGLQNKPVEAHWDYVQKLVGELREFSPVIMSPHASGEVKLSPTNAPVEFVTRQHEGKIYLIAANKSPKAQKVRFDSGLFQGRNVRILYEEHAVSIEGSSLSDKFQPLEVHVYELSEVK